MAAKKIKFTGVIKRFGGKSGGKEMLIGKLKTDGGDKLLELSAADDKDKQRITGTIELVQPDLPETETNQ